MRKKSHKLQWLEEVNHRGELTKEEANVYHRSKLGHKGETGFDKLCSYFLDKPFSIIDDITLSYQENILQMDKIIVNDHTIILIDIKNYHGQYTYVNNAWYTQKLLPHDIYEQLRRAKRITKRLLDDFHINMKVEGVLIFMNPQSEITIKDEVTETTLTYEKIPLWLMNLNENYRKCPANGWHTMIQNHTIPSYRTDYICSEKRLAQLKKGTRCQNCGSFHMIQKRYTLSCASCSFIEPKETAYARTICEYGTIMHNRSLKRSDILAFVGDDYKEKYIKNILNKHFEPEKNFGKRHIRYVNKGCQFPYWFENKSDYFEKLEQRKYWK
ncbi:nuclease-related domain-containing protein [Tetragenococcus halophilus]|uniref:nuclease-related domain-containing protein n=1 Tax=Tetragenococcus halophilus TaxID=51669 RepID=UPI00209B75F8|nr:nuclease-related domain-containing protein [Tetragenococcus halophilus]MCO8291126.1 NERD domain-containing protein [Tetragenococcus halophilus]